MNYSWTKHSVPRENIGELAVIPDNGTDEEQIKNTLQKQMPLGTIVSKWRYSNKSDIAYRKYQKTFPGLICMCKVIASERWKIDDYLTSTLLLVSSIEDQSRISIVDIQDVFKLKNSNDKPFENKTESEIHQELLVNNVIPIGALVKIPSDADPGLFPIGSKVYKKNYTGPTQLQYADFIQTHRADLSTKYPNTTCLCSIKNDQFIIKEYLATTFVYLENIDPDGRNSFGDIIDLNLVT